MRHAFAWMIVAVAFAGTHAPAGADDRLSDQLEKRTYNDKDGKPLSYRLLRPDSVAEGKKYPLVLFLHGAGERGDDNEAQIKHGVAEFARADHRAKYPCFLAAPQCPRNSSWSAIRRGDISAEARNEPTEPGRLALELVESLKSELPIDPDRVYITGLSMGGFGTWDLIARHPDRFAAAVPICGGGDPSKVETFAKLPLWAFHGAKDGTVPSERSRVMIEALWKAGAKPGYTEYPDVGHDSWTPAYKDEQLFTWLFRQARPATDAKDDKGSTQ